MMAKASGLSFRLECRELVIHEIRMDDMPSEIVIGRSADCGWRVPDDCKSVSGRHVAIVKKRSSAVIRDLKSRNGIYFAGRRIHERQLKAGDVYSIGDCKLVVEKDTASASPAEKYHVLEQLTGAEKGRTIQLKQERTRIGSGSECDIRIQDLHVSHVHAELEIKPDGSCWLKDCGSSNGTKVNGAVLADAALETGRMLQDGDIVKIAYVEYRFLDRRVVHVRSHLLSMAIAVFLTVSCVLGAYFAYTIVSPSSKALRISAERCAAAEDFARAKEFLAVASEARGHASDAKRRLELIRNIQLWSETFVKWNSIKASLSDEKANLKTINATFGTLISSSHDNWKWNATSAVSEMKNAQSTHGLLSLLLVSEGAFTAAELDTVRLKGLLADMERALAAHAQSPLPYQEHIARRLSAIKDEIALTLSEHEALQKAMQAYSSVDVADSVLAAIDGIAAANKTRCAARRARKEPVSPFIAEEAKTFRTPVVALKKSHLRLLENYRAVARWSFGEFVPELPLPSAEECISFPALAMRRKELVECNEALPAVMAQLKNFGFQFDSLSMGLDALPPVCEKLFDPERLKSVYACDSLSRPMPGYADGKPSGVYDETVGVYAFFSYLNSLDGDFDTTILDERFRPLIFAAPEIFDLLESYLDFCYGKKGGFLAQVMAEVRNSVASGDGNKVLMWAEYAEKLTSRRTAFVRQLFRTFLSDKTRRGVIAGGMACRLRGRGCSFLPEDLNMQVSERFKALRRTVGGMLLSGEDRTPEEQSAVERNVMQIALPGDGYVRQAWIDASASLERGQGK